MSPRLVEVTVPGRERPALEDVTLELQPGVVTHVLAERGGGKSTMLRVIAGLQRPTSGRLEGIGRRHALLVEGAAALPAVASSSVSLRRWLAAVARARRARPAPVPEEVALALGLTDRLDTRLVDLVPGDASAAVLAAAIVAAPPVLLLDEPVSRLSPHRQITLRPALRRLLDARAGITVIAARRAEEMVGQGGDVVILAEGRLLQRGSFASIAARPRSLRAAAVCHVPRLNMIGVLRRDGAVLLGPQLAVPAMGPLAVLADGRWTLALPADRTTLEPFDGALTLPAVVDAVETDGGIRRLSVRVGRAQWRLVLPTARRPGVGEALAIHVDPYDLMVFGDTGLLERMPGDPSAVAA